MDKNRIYKALYLHYVRQITDFDLIAEETGVSPHLLSAVVNGKRFEDVLADFMEDRKAGDFSRVYPAPKLKRLYKAEYEAKRDKYLKRMLDGKWTIKDVYYNLLEDGILENQVERMLKQIDKMYEDSLEDLLNSKLDAILEVLNRSTKLGIDWQNNLVTLYPHPVLDSRGYVRGVEYKKQKAFLLPDKLFDLYCERCDQAEEPQFKQLENGKKVITTKLALKWIDLRDKGMSLKEIAKKYKVTPNVVENNIRLVEEVM